MNAVLTRMVVSLLGQTPDLAGGAVAPDAVKVQSIWDFILKGGPTMIPIGLCSFVALTIIVERLLSLRKRQVIPPDFVPEVTKLLDDNRGDRTAAIELCQNNGSPIATVFAAAIKRINDPIELLERNIRDAGERAVFALRKNLRGLSVIASIAPLLGLLGTIFGMINAFQTVATSGDALGRTELLATGIYQAMITTAAGLLVAIPVLIAYHWLSARVERLVAEMDRVTVAFLESRGPPNGEGTGIAQPKLHAENEIESDDETAADLATASA